MDFPDEVTSFKRNLVSSQIIFIELAFENSLSGSRRITA
jgi:hypothetical protein